MDNVISRQAELTEIRKDGKWLEEQGVTSMTTHERELRDTFILREMPSAKPEQRYTEEELRVFKHGISLSLLSKRSAQHWHYDADMAIEIEFLERLYDKVSADMKGGQG